MAETSYDPLRSDPFQNNAVVPVPTTLPHQGQWSVPGTGTGSGQTPHHHGAGVVRDPLLHFQNENAHLSTSSIPAKDNTSNIHQQRVRVNTTPDTSSLSGSSRSRHRTGKSKVLDDANIAPPPDPPIARDYTQSLFHVEDLPGGDSDNNKPSFDQIQHSGYCLARISFRTLIMKKWKQVFWICYGDDCQTLLFFKTKEKFEDWIMNPYLNAAQREQMVKLRIDFNNCADERLGIKGYQVSALKRKRYSSGGML